jgi:hypothetical protein
VLARGVICVKGVSLKRLSRPGSCTGQISISAGKLFCHVRKANAPAPEYGKQKRRRRTSDLGIIFTHALVTTIFTPSKDCLLKTPPRVPEGIATPSGAGEVTLAYLNMLA